MVVWLTICRVMLGQGNRSTYARPTKLVTARPSDPLDYVLDIIMYALYVIP
jgi:hypothetical protein